jgi:phosphate transport system substrate-binding protein
MTLRNRLRVPIVGAVALLMIACGGSGGTPTNTPGTVDVGSGSLNGAGATFPEPFYTQAFYQYNQKYPNISVNYQAIGSGGGIKQFTAGTVDFGASDAAMKDTEIAAAKKKGDPVHVPTVLGAVTVAYKVSGVNKGLKLDGATIADIFLGKITKWNDPKIAAANSGTKLPSTAIAVCHRSDSSGTTKNFTQFLAAYSKAWAGGPGVDKTVKWPTGTGAKGNDGVAGCVKQTDGAVGYVEQAYALQNNFTTAAVKNKAGNYVEPSLAATSAAAEGVTPPADLRFSTIDAPGPSAYPISAITFLLVYQDMCKAGLDKTKAQLVQNWLNYGQTEGQKVAPEIQYAPLPDAIHTQAQAKVAGLVCNGQPLKQ